MVNSSGEQYDNVEEFKLLGVEFVSHPRSGVSWNKYILKCVRSAQNNMWILKRLAEMGVSIEDLLMTYQSRIRILLEMNVPLWNFSISKKMSQIMEKVQKACVFIILGKHATQDYFCNLSILDLEPLSDRRYTLCKDFATKTFKHPVHGQMFQRKEGTQTRGTRRVIVPVGKTARYNKSSVPNLARLLNE